MDNIANRIIDRCHSTNDLAKSLAESGSPHGTWVSAKIQEGGRGRLGRQWQSIEGNLFLSLILRISEKHLWSWIPLATAVAVTRCLRNQYPELPIFIKWPNDLWLGNGKLGGILCEGASSYIVVGLGLNCVQSPSNLERPASDLTSARNGIQTLADDVRLSIIHSILEEVDRLISKGPDDLRLQYENWSLLSLGVSIEWESGGSLQIGKVLGLGGSGELRVIQLNGEEKSLYAEDVRIRFNSYSDKMR